MTTKKSNGREGSGPSPTRRKKTEITKKLELVSSAKPAKRTAAAGSDVERTRTPGRGERPCVRTAGGGAGGRTATTRTGGLNCDSFACGADDPTGPGVSHGHRDSVGTARRELVDLLVTVGPRWLTGGNLRETTAAGSVEVPLGPHIRGDAATNHAARPTRPKLFSAPLRSPASSAVNWFYRFSREYFFSVEID